MKFCPLSFECALFCPLQNPFTPRDQRAKGTKGQNIFIKEK